MKLIDVYNEVDKRLKAAMLSGGLLDNIKTYTRGDFIVANDDESVPSITLTMPSGDRSAFGTSQSVLNPSVVITILNKKFVDYENNNSSYLNSEVTQPELIGGEDSLILNKYYRITGGTIGSYVVGDYFKATSSDIIEFSNEIQKVVLAEGILVDIENVINTVHALNNATSNAYVLNNKAYKMDRLAFTIEEIEGFVKAEIVFDYQTLPFTVGGL